ncbi:hypothetical protein OBBRIDRAFT_9317 [Obba rivulosa]|uniref:Uncharacterized protein n=1 Tax=Obba rivulosa TaxID=1052685 RepID=A0A8E2DVQ2_9APHY|nr:hypothetical protein OBBRIDRAFT_9317 [Obba rivulosa]
MFAFHWLELCVDSARRATIKWKSHLGPPLPSSSSLSHRIRFGWRRCSVVLSDYGKYPFHMRKRRLAVQTLYNQQYENAVQQQDPYHLPSPSVVLAHPLSSGAMPTIMYSIFPTQVPEILQYCMARLPNSTCFCGLYDFYCDGLVPPMHHPIGQPFSRCRHWWGRVPVICGGRVNPFTKIAEPCVERAVAVLRYGMHVRCPKCQ